MLDLTLFLPQTEPRAPSLASLGGLHTQPGATAANGDRWDPAKEVCYRLELLLLLLLLLMWVKVGSWTPPAGLGPPAAAWLTC